MGGPDNEAFCRGFRTVCGVDEVGRGPLAGPVVAAAVVLPPDAAGFLRGLADSKRLGCRDRAELVPRIREAAVALAVAEASAQEIDETNILKASLLAMARAVTSLGVVPDFLLVDGLHRVPLPIPQAPLVKGDARSLCIAAASNVAKEFRDARMQEYAALYPGYGFQAHLGYPTAAHRDALMRLGPCPIHRRTFRGVRELVSGSSQPDLFPFREDCN